jgi:cytoskeletal protein RodZ
MDRPSSATSEPSVDPRAQLALWLRGARARRRMSVDDVARVTKIQPRFLERLEAGEITAGEGGMPAEVFVRGFVRSFARCVGLDESEAIERYAAIEHGGVPAAIHSAGALVESFLPPVPLPEPEPEPVSVPVPVPVSVSDSVSVSVTVSDSVSVSESEPATPTKKKRAPRKKSPTSSTAGTPRAPRKKKPTQAPVDAVEAAPAPSVEPDPIPVVETVDLKLEPWKPTMPPPAPSVPWRRPSFAPRSAAGSMPNLPSLVIDDADPDRAERVREARAKQHRRTFLPPILLDRDARADTGSQRGLTLAVIILLIAATLTLSYLMRRPSSTSDGVTSIDGEDRAGDTGLV